MYIFPHQCIYMESPSNSQQGLNHPQKSLSSVFLFDSLQQRLSGPLKMFSFFSSSSDMSKTQTIKVEMELE